MKRSAVVLLLVLAACAPVESPSASVAAPPSETTAASTEPAASEPAASEPPAAEAPVTITGSGIENSAPFHLGGGIYLVEFTATPRSDQGCYHGAYLQSADPNAPVYERLASELLESAAPLSGTTYIYDLAAGDYYINANSGCDWSFTFTAQ